MDDAYTRLKYIKKINPQYREKEEDFEDEVGIQDWEEFFEQKWFKWL